MNNWKHISYNTVGNGLESWREGEERTTQKERQSGHTSGVMATAGHTLGGQRRLKKEGGWMKKGVHNSRNSYKEEEGNIFVQYHYSMYCTN